MAPNMTHFTAAILDALGELDCARGQMLPTDDQIIREHVISVCAKLKAIHKIAAAVERGQQSGKEDR